MKTLFKFFLIFGFGLIMQTAFAELKIPVYNTGTGQSVGYIIAQDSQYGLLLTPHLFGLPPGIHGFHIHTDASCSDHGMDAMGHLDPSHTGLHLGPYNPNGHLGDLPVLIVDSNGNATLPILAPRLTLKIIENHAIMIHAGADNYSDIPEKLGGGGARIACGVIP